MSVYINSIQPFHLSPKDKRYRSSTQSSFGTAAPATLRKNCVFTLWNSGSEEVCCIQCRLCLFRTERYNREKRRKDSIWEVKAHADYTHMCDFTLWEMELVQKFEFLGHISMIHPTCIDKIDLIYPSSTGSWGKAGGNPLEGRRVRIQSILYTHITI